MYQGQVVSNGLVDLWIDENGNILLSGVTGLFTLADASRQIIAKPAEGLAYAGNIYKTDYNPSSKRSLIFINNITCQERNKKSTESRFKMSTFSQTKSPVQFFNIPSRLFSVN